MSGPGSSCPLACEKAQRLGLYPDASYWFQRLTDISTVRSLEEPDHGALIIIIRPGALRRQPGGAIAAPALVDSSVRQARPSLKLDLRLAGLETRARELPSQVNARLQMLTSCIACA